VRAGAGLSGAGNMLLADAQTHAHFFRSVANVTLQSPECSM
jgi:hypothetical protein